MLYYTILYAEGTDDVDGSASASIARAFSSG